MHAVLQIALLKTFKCAVGVHFLLLKLCMILPDLGVLKIVLLKTILGMRWCAIVLTRLKRQGLTITSARDIWF